MSALAALAIIYLFIGVVLAIAADWLDGDGKSILDRLLDTIYFLVAWPWYLAGLARRTQ